MFLPFVTDWVANAMGKFKVFCVQPINASHVFHSRSYLWCFFPSVLCPSVQSPATTNNRLNKVEKQPFTNLRSQHSTKMLQWWMQSEAFGWLINLLFLFILFQSSRFMSLALITAISQWNCVCISPGMFTLHKPCFSPGEPYRNRSLIRANTSNTPSTNL